MSKKKIHRAAELAAYKTGVLKAEGLDDDRDRYLRLAAEFDNYKKRTSRQYAEIISSANVELIVELLFVIDDFERALDAFKANGESPDSIEKDSFVSGMKLIYDKLIALLRNRGVEKMDALDKPFDPVYHEAVMQRESEKEEGTVIDVISPGYMLKDRVIRHAKVIVATSKI